MKSYSDKITITDISSVVEKHRGVVDFFFLLTAPDKQMVSLSRKREIPSEIVSSSP